MVPIQDRYSTSIVLSLVFSITGRFEESYSKPYKRLRRRVTHVKGRNPRTS